MADAIEKTGLKIELVGFESGSLSHYLMQGFRERTLNVVCVDAILSVNINKTDKNDARGIANAMRTGMFSRVHDKPKEAIDRGAVLAMRHCLIRQRTDIKNHVRGVLKAYGIRLGSVGPAKFHEVVKFRIHELNPLVHETMEGMLELFDALNQKISQIDKELLKISKEDREVRLLMTIPGVGPIVALTYKAEIHDPRRFPNSRTVGAYLGMTPTQYSSGETCRLGRISRCGSKELRSLLTEAGLVLITRTKKWSRLKAWGLKLMKKKGIKKASLAVGRKLSVIMHRMLIEEKEFRYGEAVKKAA
ncbi:MAG: IS110 family transposase [Simkaniaceae bacterium]|nr:MAG: IS110 family transposase [Simkaniaceae bacterium]